MKEHRTAVVKGDTGKSALAQHHLGTGHIPDFSNVEVMDRDPAFLKRRIKEAIHIHQEPSPMNRDEGLALPAQYKPLFLGHKGRNPNQFRDQPTRLLLHPTFHPSLPPSSSDPN